MFLTALQPNKAAMSLSLSFSNTDEAFHLVVLCKYTRSMVSSWRRVCVSIWVCVYLFTWVFRFVYNIHRVGGEKTIQRRGGGRGLEEKAAPGGTSQQGLWDNHECSIKQLLMPTYTHADCYFCSIPSINHNPESHTSVFIYTVKYMNVCVCVCVCVDSVWFGEAHSEGGDGKRADQGASRTQPLCSALWPQTDQLWCRYRAASSAN